MIEVNGDILRVNLKYPVFVLLEVVKISTLLQVLACGTSDQLLHFAQSVTAKLDVDVVINYSRDLSVKIASTEGLSDNLAALVKQVGVTTCGA